MLGVFLDQGSLQAGDIDMSPLERTLPVWNSYDDTAPYEAAERVRDAAVVVTNKGTVDAALLRAAPGLRLVCVAATGVNNVDLEAARREDVTVCNVPGYATPSVAQHVFALMLGLSTRLTDYQILSRDGHWQRSPHFCLLRYPIGELAGKRLGIVGYGTLGQAVAGIARAFGMEVLIAQRPGGEPAPGRMPLAKLLPEVDVLTLHCPLTPQTQGLIGEQALQAMKPSALLINTARGGIVDEYALAAALRAGDIAGAGVDVLSEEPPAGGNPLLAPDIPNLLLTPHIAWASREARQRLVAELAANVAAYLEGNPRNVVT